MRIFFLICGILLVLGGLLLMLAVPVAGLVFTVLGVLSIFYSKKYKNKTAAENAPVESAPVAQESSTTKETIRVAGISNYTDAVLSLGHENDEYDYTKKEIIENGMEDEDIYQYYFRPLPAEFVFEPDNPYDSNAIAIYVVGEKIGYVKSGSTAHIRKLIQSGKLESASCQITGGKSKRYDSDTETIEQTDLNYGAKITLTINNENS